MIVDRHAETELLDLSVPPQVIEVHVARRTLARVYLTGRGIEVGAGTRPWPLPPGTTCYYGDTRNREELATYFLQEGSSFEGIIDAQTFAGIPDRSADFVLSAHVLEHLVDPIGGIAAMIRVARPGGIVMFAVPDKRYTWDNPRPITTLDHLISDYRSGGDDTRFAACLEHIRYLHPQWADPIPENEHEAHAVRLSKGRGGAHFDTHYHTWTTCSFCEMIEWIAQEFPAAIEHIEIVLNENIAVLRKA